MSRRLPVARALDAHCKSLLDCRRCGNMPGITPIISRARSPLGMLVGQAPGKTEVELSRPFSGRAGRTLFKWLAEAGLDEQSARELFYFAAITRCFPGSHPSGRGDRLPSPSERARCSDWLADELRIIRPPVIIPVGRLAIDRFLGPLPLDQAVGREHSVVESFGSTVVIPLPHPSGASSWIHAPEHRRLLEESLVLIKRRLSFTKNRSAA